MILLWLVLLLVVAGRAFYVAQQNSSRPWTPTQEGE